MIPSAAWLRRGAARTLVKILALQPSHRMHREELLEFLYPDVDLDSALNRFAKALHAARRALEPELEPRSESSYLHLSEDIVSLDMANVWVDVDAFQRLATEALSGGAGPAIEVALEAYTGSLLPEDRYEDWVTARRESLSALHYRLQVALALERERQRDLDGAVAIWREILEADRAHEEAYRALMRLYALQGEKGLAIGQYEAARVALREELNADPEAETEALYGDIVQGKISPAVRPISDASITTSLPAVIRHEASGPFIGRARALEFMREDLTAAERGPGRTVLIGGEGGIGKTRLAAELAREAGTEGAVVLWGASFTQEQLTPYGPFLEALESFFVNRPSAELDEVAERYPMMARLIPSLSGRSPLPTESTSPEVAHARLVASFGAVLAGLGANGPLVLVLDNIHDADAASLHLLQHLVRMARDHRWLIVATYRSNEVEPDSHLARLLESMRRERLGRRIALSRFSADDTGTLLGELLAEGQPDSSLVNRIYGLSLGNPLFAIEIIRAMQQEGALVLEGGLWKLTPIPAVRIPAGLRYMVVGRMTQLDSRVQMLLNLAAVLGQELSFEDLRAAARIALYSTIPETDLPEVLDRALRTGILTYRENIYAFTHPLIRTSLLESLSPHRLMPLHAAVAEVIEARNPNEVDRLAYHYDRSGNESKAIEYLRRAGDRAQALYANEEAARHYDVLVERLESTGQAVEAARARSQLGTALYTLGQFGRSLEELLAAARTFESSANMEWLGYVTAQIGHVHFLQGTPRDGVSAVTSLLDRAGDAMPDVSRAALLMCLASLYWLLGRYEEELSAASKALELLEEPIKEGNDAAVYVRAHASVWYGVALAALDRQEESIEALRIAVQYSEQTGNLLALSRAYNTLASVLEERGYYLEQEPYLDKALEAAVQLGNPGRIAFMLQRRGWHRWVTGHWPEARGDLERALQIDCLQPSSSSPSILYGLGWIQFTEGDWDSASRLLEQALAAGERIGDVRTMWAASSVLAERDLGEGRYDEARTRLEALRGNPGMAAADTAYVHVLLAQIALETGDLDEAARLVTEALAYSREHGLRPILADALRVKGIVHSRQGDWTQARASFEGALRLVRDMKNRYQEGRVLCAFGEEQARFGEVERGIALLRDSLAIFRDVGARKVAEHVERLLDDLASSDVAPSRKP